MTDLLTGSVGTLGIAPAVLFVTGFAGEAEADMFGGRGVLRKPFTMASLGRAVSEAVDFEARRAAQQAA